jgi:hypothetical protein
MLADLLTKVLPPSMFKEHLAGMGLRESLRFLDHERPEKKQNLFKNREVCCSCLILSAIEL